MDMYEVFDKIKGSTILIGYFFLCGSLYLFSFWKSFNINVFEKIEIWDIPKSFIYPLMVYSVVFLFAYLLGKDTVYSSKNYTVVRKLILRPRLKKYRIGVGVICLAIITFDFGGLYEIVIDAIALMQIHLFVGDLILNDTYLMPKNKLVTNKLLYRYIIMAPLLIFLLGKINATYLIFFKNAETELIGYTNNSNHCFNKFKIIGNISGSIVLLTSDNSKILVLDEKKFDGYIKQANFKPVIPLLDIWK